MATALRTRSRAIRRRSHRECWIITRRLPKLSTHRGPTTITARFTRSCAERWWSDETTDSHRAPVHGDPGACQRTACPGSCLVADVGDPGCLVIPGAATA